MSSPPALRPGNTGEAVRDLQRRLAALGYEVEPSEHGEFGPLTSRAVREFQTRRGLHVDGVCGVETWNALVESGFRLGDRMLYFRHPMVRGDDVAELQRQLNALGFDAGREDGIFGGDTLRALVDFQANVGLATDGICGPGTVAGLRRVGSLAEGSVASVRERDQLRRNPGRLGGRRVYLAAAAGFEALGRSVAHELDSLGAVTLLDASGQASSALADEANRFTAELVLAIQAGDSHEARCSYFESGRFRSEAGYRIACSVSDELRPVMPDVGTVAGRRYAILRETRMPAVVCELVRQHDVDAMRRLVSVVGAAGRAIAAGVRRGIEEPPPEE